MKKNYTITIFIAVALVVVIIYFYQLDNKKSDNNTTIIKKDTYKSFKKEKAAIVHNKVVNKSKGIINKKAIKSKSVQDFIKDNNLVSYGSYNLDDADYEIYIDRKYTELKKPKSPQELIQMMPLLMPTVMKIQLPNGKEIVSTLPSGAVKDNNVYLLGKNGNNEDITKVKIDSENNNTQKGFVGRI